MKLLFIILLLIFFSDIGIQAQKSNIERFQNDIETSETISDTLASILSLKILTKKDTAIAANIIDKVLRSTYANLADIEQKLIYNEEISRLELEEILVSENSSVVKKHLQYYATLIDIKNDVQIEIDSLAIKNEMLTTADLLDYYYYITICRSSEAKKLILNQVGTISQWAQQKSYPAIKLALISNYNHFIYGQLTIEGEALINQGLQIAEEIGAYYELTQYYNQLLILKKNKGDYINAFDISNKVIESAKLANWDAMIIQSQVNHATFQQEQGQFEEAYKMIFQAREYATKIDDKGSIAMTYGGEAFAKMNETKYDEAIRLLKKSIATHPNDKNTRHFNNLNYANIITSYYQLNKLDSAYYYYEKLVEEDPDDIEGMHGYAKIYIVQLLVEQGEYDRAEKYIEDGMADAEAYNDLSGKSIALMAKSRLLEAKNRYKEALEVHKEHMAIEQDFRNEEKAAEITQMSLNAEFKKEKEIIALQNEKEKDVLQLRQQRTAAIGGLAFLGLLGLLFFYRSLRKRTALIEQQKAELETLNQTKDTLFQIIGHDLKKPTIGFRNVSKNINYLLEKEDYTRLKKLVEEVDQDAKSLYNLTDNLLAWALIQKDIIKLKNEKVNAFQITQDNVQLFQNLAKTKNIQLINNVQKKCILNADHNAVDTVIRNLIDNAIKFTPNGGIVTIGNESQDSKQRLYVEDTGKGMTLEKIKKLESGKALSSIEGTKGEKGSGIGLQLVKELVNKSKGKIEIVKKANQGMIFSIYFTKFI